MARELIKDGEAGFLITGKDQEITERITQLTDKNLRKKMGNALKEKVRNLYGWQGVIDQYMELYQSL